MIKTILVLAILNSITFAENIYLKCTLVHHNNEEISERYAKSHDEFEINVILKNEKLFFNSPYESTYQKTTKENQDIYFDWARQMYLIDSDKQTIAFVENYDSKNILHNGAFSKKLYDCRKATNYEKAMMLFE